MSHFHKKHRLISTLTATTHIIKKVVTGPCLPLCSILASTGKQSANIWELRGPAAGFTGEDCVPFLSDPTVGLDLLFFKF